MKKLIFALSALCLAGTACKDKEPEKQVCNVNNPLTDLPWLKSNVDEIVSLFQAGNPLRVSIYECIYGNGETGFLVDKGNIKPFYNCNGEVLCVMGGHAGETCPELNISSEKLIWTTDDLNVEITCNFNNPLTDLPWLKSFIETEPLPYRRIYQCTYKNGIGFLCETKNLGYIFRGCHGAALCGELVEDCEKLGIDFENKQLIWEYSETND